MVLGCGEKLKDGMKDTTPKAKTENKLKSDDRTTGRTQGISTPKGRLYFVSSGERDGRRVGLIAKVKGPRDIVFVFV